MVYLIDHTFINLIIVLLVDLMPLGYQISDSYKERIPIVIILIHHPTIFIKWRRNKTITVLTNTPSDR